MDKRPDDLYGMDAAGAKEYILSHITTLKLTEKKLRELDSELAEWNSRLELTRLHGATELIPEAEKRTGEIKAKQALLSGEAEDLKKQIETMRTQLPGLAARERSIDPDLLEQELLISAGHLPGDEEKVKNERILRELQKDNDAETALAELKAKMEQEGRG
jgi:hypothetical protein